MSGSLQLALDLFERHRAEWLARARAIARDLGKDGAPVCADDVHGRRRGRPADHRSDRAGDHAD